MLTKLTTAEVQAALEKLPGWSLDEGKLHKEFKFIDFRSAFGFLSMVALKCEAMNHHPEWFNVYSTVRVWLTSHEVDGISGNDVFVAQDMEMVARCYRQPSQTR